MTKRILISDFVKGLRNERKISVRDFAKEYNVSKALISKYESGKCDDPSIIVATTFCNTFKISLDKFSQDFFYTDNRIKSAYSITAHLSKRLGSEWSDSFGHNMARRFYDAFEEKCGLSEFTLCDSTKEYQEAKDDEVYIDRSGRCLAKDNKEVWICPYLRVPEFQKKPRNINYDYMMSEIASVAAISSEKLKCGYFIYITQSRGMFNYFKKLEFHSYDTSGYLVYSEDSKNFEEIHKLYGKDFLGLEKRI